MTSMFITMCNIGSQNSCEHIYRQNGRWYQLLGALHLLDGKEETSVNRDQSRSERQERTKTVDSPS